MTAIDVGKKVSDILNQLGESRFIKMQDTDAPKDAKDAEGSEDTEEEVEKYEKYYFYNNFGLRLEFFLGIMTVKIGDDDEPVYRWQTITNELLCKPGEWQELIATLHAKIPRLKEFKRIRDICARNREWLNSWASIRLEVSNGADYGSSIRIYEVSWKGLLFKKRSERLVFDYRSYYIDKGEWLKLVQEVADNEKRAKQPVGTEPVVERGRDLDMQSHLNKLNSI